MDVSLCISELLKKNGEIIIPRLGLLVNARMSAYYNEADGIFYPPYHQVQFLAQDVDDDTLAQFIADIKNISLASARYFTQKYIENIKNDALVKEVPLADLGWLYMEQASMSFRVNDALTEDTDFYGYQPVEIQKQRRKVVAVNKKVNTDDAKVINKPAPVYVAEEMPNITFKSKSAEDKPEDDRFPSVLQLDKVHEEQVKRRYAILYTVLSVVLILAVIFLAIYEFSPATYQRFVAWEKQLRGVPTDENNDIIKYTVKTDAVIKPKTDSLKKDSLAKADSIGRVDSLNRVDSLLKIKEQTQTVVTKKAEPPIVAVKKSPVNPPVNTPSNGEPSLVTHPITIEKKIIKAPKKDTTTKKKASQSQQADNSGSSHFEVILGSSATLSGANATINRLSEEGISASISIDMPSPPNYIALSVSYATRAEAEAEMQRLLKENKISNTSYVKEIK